MTSVARHTLRLLYLVMRLSGCSVCLSGEFNCSKTLSVWGFASDESGGRYESLSLASGHLVGRFGRNVKVSTLIGFAAIQVAGKFHPEDIPSFGAGWPSAGREHVWNELDIKAHSHFMTNPVVRCWLRAGVRFRTSRGSERVVWILLLSRIPPNYSHVSNG